LLVDLSETHVQPLIRDQIITGDSVPSAQHIADGELEYHPELGAGHDVSLGLVGSEFLHRAGLR
jgi:hypothetical protein